MRRKQTHCLFIEEESYNWSAPNSAKHYRLIAVSVLVIVAGLLFSLYASRQNTLTHQRACRVAETLRVCSPR